MLQSWTWCQGFEEHNNCKFAFTRFRGNNFHGSRRASLTVLPDLKTLEERISKWRSSTVAMVCGDCVRAHLGSSSLYQHNMLQAAQKRPLWVLLVDVETSHLCLPCQNIGREVNALNVAPKQHHTGTSSTTYTGTRILHVHQSFVGAVFPVEDSSAKNQKLCSSKFGVIL